MSAAWAGLHPRSGSMEAGEGRHELDTGRNTLVDWPMGPDSPAGLVVVAR